MPKLESRVSAPAGMFGAGITVETGAWLVVLEMGVGIVVEEIGGTEVVDDTGAVPAIH